MAGSRPFFAVASTDANGRIHVITGTNDAATAVAVAFDHAIVDADAVADAGADAIAVVGTDFAAPASSVSLAELDSDFFAVAGAYRDPVDKPLAHHADAVSHHGPDPSAHRGANG
jgi:dihydrodipicolinate synthase/N-acetylneuraminate lyase